jgi:hypothetical protein
MNARALSFSRIVLLFSVIVSSVRQGDQECCSHHGGVAYCDSHNGVLLCQDNTYSPICGCLKYEPPSQQDSSAKTDAHSPTQKPETTPSNDSNSKNWDGRM